MIELNDADWELFVPVKGEKYPNHYQVKLHDNSVWQDGGSPGLRVKSPTCYAYRKPKQKENKMPDRTPQQALKDAIDSGAVDAWLNGEEVEFHRGAGDWGKDWSSSPSFTDPICFFRPKPPEPTKINWRPVVTGKEPRGTVLGLFKYSDRCEVHSVVYAGAAWVDEGENDYLSPTHWAPMCNLPEGDK